tara:strand:- start:4694 stop:4810 length:117 start_codon:yes stop_codon:yes gene_type:complete
VISGFIYLHIHIDLQIHIDLHIHLDAQNGWERGLSRVN